MKNTKIYEGKIPWNPIKNEPLYYAERMCVGYDEKGEWKKAEPIWKPNEIFSDVLEYKSYYRGRSAAGLEFKSITTGVSYVVFMTDFDDMVKHMVNGIIKGSFVFCKRGANYGLRMVFDAPST